MPKAMEGRGGTVEEGGAEAVTASTPRGAFGGCLRAPAPRSGPDRSNATPTPLAFARTVARITRCQDDDHALVVLRYIEANPLRAGRVADLADYRWSSYGVHGFGRADV